MGWGQRCWGLEANEKHYDQTRLSRLDEPCDRLLQTAADSELAGLWVPVQAAVRVQHGGRERKAARVALRQVRARSRREIALRDRFALRVRPAEALLQQAVELFSKLAGLLGVRGRHQPACR